MQTTGADYKCWSQVLITGADYMCWSQVLNTGVDHRCWQQVLITGADHRSWSQVLNMGIDHRYWSQMLNIGVKSQVLSTGVDQSCWPQVLITGAEHRCWSQVVQESFRIPVENSGPIPELSFLMLAMQPGTFIYFPLWVLSPPRFPSHWILTVNDKSNKNTHPQEKNQCCDLKSHIFPLPKVWIFFLATQYLRY